MTINSTITRGTASSGASGRSFDKLVRHGGRSFLATSTMAAIFTARASDVVARADSELVPLLHRDGVELLLIGPHTVFAVTDVAARSGGISPRA